MSNNGSGVFEFKNGVINLNRAPETSNGSQRRKVLVHLPTGQQISSYPFLEEILTSLGWKRYYGGNNPDLLQFDRPSSIDLISVPRDFSKFNSVHMFDIVVKNPTIFQVRDM